MVQMRLAILQDAAQLHKIQVAIAVGAPCKPSNAKQRYAIIGWVYLLGRTTELLQGTSLSHEQLPGAQILATCGLADWERAVL
jgi:hypothetical protein